MTFNIRSDSSQGQIAISYLMAIVVFALSLTSYELFANQENCINFDLENEGQGQGVEKLDLRLSTRTVRIHIGDFFSEFYLPGNIRLCKRIHTARGRSDDYRQNLQSRRRIFTIVIFPALRDELHWLSIKQNKKITLKLASFPSKR